MEEKLEIKDDSVVYSEQLDYSKHPNSFPSYKYKKILPQNGSQAVSIQPGGGASTTFEIPAKVFNLAQSYITCDVAIAESAVAGQYTIAHVDAVALLRQAIFKTRAEQLLADVKEIGTYTSTVQLYETKASDYLAFEEPKKTTGIVTSEHKFLGKSNNFAQWADAQILVPDPTPNDAEYFATAQKWNPRPVHTGDGTQPAMYDSDVNFLEHQHVLIGAAAAGGAGNIAYSVQLPLSVLYNSLFALDKDLYFGGQVMIMQLNWAPATAVYYTTNDPHLIASNPLDATMNAELTNVQLMLAVEEDPQVEYKIMKQTQKAEGLNVRIPYVDMNQMAIPASTNQTVTLRINRANGSHLLKLYHSLFGVQDAFSQYDHDNRIDGGNSKKVTSYYTLLDDVRRQDFDIDTSDNDDYWLMLPKIKGSAVLSKDIFKYNWAHIEDFASTLSPADLPATPNQINVIRGLPLETEHKWSFYAQTTNNPFTHYTFYVTTKDLIINNEGITIY